MTLEEQLKQEILSRYKSIREFSAMTQIPYSTVDSVLKRGIKNSGVGTVIKIFSFLDIDVESISSESLKHIDALEKTKKSPSVTEAAPGEEQIVMLYRELNTEGQERLLNYADDLVASGKYIKSDKNTLGKEKFA